MKGLKSEHVDISFILGQKLSPPRSLRTLNETTTIIHGWDIKIFSLVDGFSKNSNSNVRSVQRKSVTLTQGTKLEEENN